MELSPASVGLRRRRGFREDHREGRSLVGSDTTSIVPPWAPTTLFANARPSPVPCSFGFVVKNGWKSFWMTSGDIPGPVSWTITATVSPRSSIPTVTAPDEVA